MNAGFALLLATLAGLSTGIGSAIAWFIRRPSPSYLALLLGFSAGVMTYISFAELLTTAMREVGLATANIGFFIGIALLAIIDMAIPHEYKEERARGTSPTTRDKDDATHNDEADLSAPLRMVRPAALRRTGYLTAIGITIHNFPEGLSVFAAASTKDTSLGILIAIAIALHNIPEGISVSVPIAAATGNRRRAFLYSFASGLAEPLGALIGYAVLRPFLTPMLLFSLLAFAGGVMIYISLDELLPAAHQFGRAHFAIAGVIAGMLVMAISLVLMH